jgi:hypothetical protein
MDHIVPVRQVDGKIPDRWMKKTNISRVLETAKREAVSKMISQEKTRMWVAEKVADQRRQQLKLERLNLTQEREKMDRKKNSDALVRLWNAQKNVELFHKRFAARKKVNPRARLSNRDKAELIYNAHVKTLFSVPIVAEKVRMLYADRGIRVTHDHVLRKIDLERRIATFRTPNGDSEQRYDFINVVPPMRAPAVVRNSPLPWQTGPWAADGWAEVNRHSLRHVRFPEVFCVGDVAGVPKGKTAASVKWQVPVAVDHLIAAIQQRESKESYNGYTSCPLITRVGRAMLVEFDYNDNLVPSFPGIIAPLEELWITWIMKEVGLKPTYLAMLRGKA